MIYSDVSSSGVRIVDQFDDADIDIIRITVDKIPLHVRHLMYTVSGTHIDIVNSGIITRHPMYRDLADEKVLGGITFAECKGISPNGRFGGLPGVVCYKCNNFAYNLYHEYGHALDYYVYGIHYGPINPNLRDTWNSLLKPSIGDTYYDRSEEYFAHALALYMDKSPTLLQVCGGKVYEFIDYLVNNHSRRVICT
jgi:hypothetical protein